MFFLFSSRKGPRRTSDATAEQLEKAMLDNNASDLHQIFKKMAGNEDESALKVSCLSRMITGPQAFFDPMPLIEAITERNFSFRDFFQYTTPENSLLETSIWGMYEKNPKHEMAKAAARFMAEYLSYRILKEGSDFKTSYQEYIKGDDSKGLSEISDMAHRKASVIATQNALAVYMKTAPAGTPVQDARLMLPLVKEITDPDVLCLWEKKMSDISIRAKEGLYGARVVLNPVFSIG